MRLQLDSFDVQIAGAATPCSTTIGTVGGYVVVVATTLPDRAIGLTSCYLGQLAGAIAASHLRLARTGDEHLRVQILERPRHVGEHARACLLDHAAELQDAIAELVDEPVTVEVRAGALDRAADAWGPAQPH